MTRRSKRELAAVVEDLQRGERRGVLSVFHIIPEIVHGYEVAMAPGEPERVLMDGEWFETDDHAQEILRDWPLEESEGQQ